MEKMEEYEDALLNMQLCEAMERRVALIEKRQPKPTTVLRKCCVAISNRLEHHEVKLVVLGICRQAYPAAALSKTVREYNAIMKEIREKGHVILKFKR